MSRGCLRALSATAFLAACGLLFVRCACMRELSGDGPPPPESKGPWAVNGIRLGATEAECRAVLPGEPEELRARAGQMSLVWRTGSDVYVTFDANGACDVLGDALTDLAGNDVAGRGTSVEDVRSVLPRAKERRHSRPKGGGVISIGREHVGTSFEWTDAHGAWSVWFAEDRLSSVRAARAR